MKRPVSSQDPRRIPEQLRRKYDVRGPRYTSYPPANHFGPVDEQELLRRWRARNELADDPGLSLYLHIPFCRRRCLFCGCHTFVAKNAGQAGRYVSALIAEMKLAAGIIDPARPLRQIALGGGTPNFLEAGELDRLLRALHDTWAVQADAEKSVEINPRTATEEKLEVFLEHGFNRFSLGIQDFDPEVLRAVRRDQGLMEVEEVVSHLRGRGVDLLNFDLIYGLPGQELAGCLATADKVIELRPTRIALYSYAHVPWIHGHQRALEKLGLPGAEAKAEIFLALMDRFLAAGYLPIGMDHFALPEDSLARALQAGTLRRNFMGYTTGRGLDLLACGASAISAVGSTYAQDEKPLPAYLEGVEAGRLPVFRGFLLDRDDEIRRELLLELFCNFRLDLRALGQRFDIDATAYLAGDIERLDPLVRDGLVEIHDETIHVTDIGRFFIRNICMTFDRYLETDGGKRVYSRTI